MIAHPHTMTAEEFETFALRPENVQRRLEFIEARIVELVSNNVSSKIAMFIGTMLTFFAHTNKLGWTTGADGGYAVGEHRYIPDVAFVSFRRQAGPDGQSYNALPPDLAVEVLSPSDDMSEVRLKIVTYLHAGTTVWLVDPENRRVEIYTPGQPPRTLGSDGILDGGDVLPGFTLPVRDIFGDEAALQS